MPRWIDLKVDGWTGHFRSEPDLLCKFTLRPRCLVAFEGVNTGRRFLGCHHEQPSCDFVMYVDKEHSPGVGTCAGHDVEAGCRQLV